MLSGFEDSVFASLGARDVLDIALIAFIIYRTLLVLKGTRAFQSLIGLLGLGVLYLLARWLDLYSVRWVLDKFFVYLVLAVLIFGVATFARGGEFNRKYSNKIMQLRILVQFIAVILILGAVALARMGS